MESTEEEDVRSIRRLVRGIVTSGKDHLDCRMMKALKNICQQSEVFIPELYKYLLKWLKKKHSEIRFSTFQIINEIFVRSHCFRCLVIKDLVHISKFAIHGLSKFPLPKPTCQADKLSKFAIKVINNWHLKYSEGYCELALAHDYLQRCKYVNYDRQAVITPGQLERIAAKEEKERSIMLKRIGKIRSEMEEYAGEIGSTRTTFDNCFKLIIPDVCQFHVSEHNNTDDVNFDSDNSDSDNDYNAKHGSTFMQRHGFTTETTVQINLLDINKVSTTMDNQILINTLKDQVIVIKKILLPRVRAWESSIMQYASTQVALTKQIIDSKLHLDNIVRRYESVSFLPPVIDPHEQPVSDSESDDDFEDVPMEQSELEMLGLSGNRPQNCGSSAISAKDRLEAGPSGVQRGEPHTITKASPLQRTSSDIDHFSSTDWEPSVTIVRGALDSNQIWSANEVLHDYDASKAPSLLGVSTQIVDYQRPFEPIKWECRAPLPSGRLCPRKDRSSCPLHGPVVARNLVGRPINDSDIVKDNLRRGENERKNPAWQEPSLLADIKRQTGVDLDMRKAKRRKGLYGKLTPIRINNARSRITKKIFCRKALRKLHNTLYK